MVNNAGFLLEKGSLDKKVITFSPEFVSIVVETNRLIDLALKNSVGFSSTDYCILQQLFALQRKAELSALQEFFLLKPNSISTAVLRLEERGYLVKEPIEKDLRSFYVSITESGTHVAEKASLAIRDILTERTWNQNPQDSRINDCMEVHASLFYRKNPSLKNIKLANDYFVVPGWVNGLKIVQALWTSTLRKKYHFPLSEYRILALLSEREDAVRPADIAEHLFLDRSAISVLTKELREEGYVNSRTNNVDKRSSFVSITDKGRDIQNQAHGILFEATAKHFEDLDQKDIDTLNQWHLEMCAMMYL